MTRWIQWYQSKNDSMDFCDVVDSSKKFAISNKGKIYDIFGHVNISDVRMKTWVINSGVLNSFFSFCLVHYIGLGVHVQLYSCSIQEQVFSLEKFKNKWVMIYFRFNNLGTGRLFFSVVQIKNNLLFFHKKTIFCSVFHDGL